MAQCKDSAFEFIQDVFSPMVAVLCSSDVQTVCQKNNLTFVELIQPFCRLSAEAHIRDVNNVTHIIRNQRMIVRDMTVTQPQAVLAARLLNETVSNVLPPPQQHLDLVQPNNVLTVGNHELQLDATTPWFEAYRAAFLQIAYPSDHEFLFHYIACMFVVSSGASDPMDQFARLTQQQHLQQHQQPQKLPKWFSPNILRYYVLVHDVIEQEESKAEAVFQTMKTKYGIQSCHLLHINSRSPTTDGSQNQSSSDNEVLPNPWGRYVTRRVESAQDLSEVEFFNSDDDGFPSHVNELSVQSAAVDIEPSFEATEDSVMQSEPVMLPPSLSTPIIYDPLGSNVPDGVTLPATSTSSNDIESSNYNRPFDSRVHDHMSGRAGTSKSTQYGASLTLSDHERLRVFTHEFMVRGLIAWAEKTIRSLNEQTMTRKGIHRGLLSATKKWFGGGRQPQPTVITNNTNVVYMSEAPEMQTRRLADLAFMFQLYELAYQTYHTAKKDFNNDHALLHYAGAMEMAFLAIFMQGASSQRPCPLHYMETTITTYLNVSKAQHFATRATLLSTEVLKSKGLYAEAATQFIKMTSEESDLRSALLLEQAAHCFIKMKSPMVRKYAFHMVLAGHRFIKAGQKQHALRSYAQALQVFKSRNWTLAEDHINFTIGVQAFNLKQLDIATSAFKHLLSVDSKQSLPQQTAFLKEYLCVFKQLTSQCEEGSTRELPQLPLPSVLVNSVKVLCGNLHDSAVADPGIIHASGVTFDTSEEDDARFSKLEEQLMVTLSQQSGSGSSQTFRPTIQCFTHRTINNYGPVVGVGEYITIEVELVNPIRVGLLMQDVVLLWKFSSASCDSDAVNQKMEIVEMEFGKKCEEVGAGVVQFSTIPEVVLDGLEQKKVHLAINVRREGQLQITGLAFHLNCAVIPSVPLGSVPTNSAVATPGGATQGMNSLPFSNSLSNGPLMEMTMMSGRINLEVQGQRLNSTKEERMGRFYGLDKRLSPTIVTGLPKLDIVFHEFPTVIFCGEVRRMTVDFVNSGWQSLANIKVTSSHPQLFLCTRSVRVPQTTQTNAYPLRESNDCATGIKKDGKDVSVVTGCLIDGILDVGGKASITMWIRGPEEPGEHVIDFLFYYEATDKKSLVRYRFVRHTAHVIAHHSLLVRAACHRIVCDTAPSTTNKTVQHLANSVVAAITVEHTGSITGDAVLEFSIRQITCASRDWKLQPLQTGVSLSALFESRIASHECLQLALRAVRCRPDSSRQEITFSDVSLDTETIDTFNSVCTDFYYRSQFVVNPASSSSGLVSYADKLRASLEAAELYATRLERVLDIDLTLIILWKAVVCDSVEDRTYVVVGQHHVTINKLNTSVSCPLIAKTAVDQPPVKFTIARDVDEVNEPSPELMSQLLIFRIAHPPTVLHDFAKQRLCLVTVTLDLLNCSDVELIVDIDTRPSHDRSLSSRPPLQQAYPSLYQDRPSLCFTWVGQKLTRLRLAPNSDHHIKRTVCFSQAGLYDLSSLQLLAGPTEPLGSQSVTPAIQRPISPALIIVQNSTCTAAAG